jgi:lipopolysaccharide export system protein LptA
MFHTAKYLCLVFFLMMARLSFGQVTPPSEPQADTSIREFEIIRGPSMRAIRIDSVTTLQTIAGGAIIKQGSTLFHSDSAVVNPTTHILEAFGNIEINQADTVHTYSQYLKYLGVEKIAFLKNKVKLTNHSGTLFTDELDYNLQTGIGNFHNGGKVIEGKSVITSTEGTYYDDTKDIYFKKNVKLDEPSKHIRADSLLYNMRTRKSDFISQTNIKTPEVEINTTQGTYDLNTGDAFFTSRTTVKDSSDRLYSANTMALENKTGNAQLEGNAVIIDSAGGYTIIANQVFLNKKNNSFLATRKPVLILKQKDDSTYVAADTIFSGFTTFVNNTNQVLQKDSTINVNLEENEKVQQTIAGDSIYKTWAILQEENIKAIKKSSLNDTARISPLNNKLIDQGKENVAPPVRDTSPDKARPDKRKKRRLTPKVDLKKEPQLKNNGTDSALLKAPSPKVNRLKLPGDSVALKDSLPKKTIPAIDSSSLDSIPTNITSEISDSLQSTSGLLKDSTNKSDTAIRYFLAFHHVKIYNDSLQSVCDSMFISSKDSVFRLYYDPVVWSGNTQIAGDTIFLYTENKQPKRLYVFESGLIVNKTKEGFFNQMSGKTINGYFIDGKIDYMRVKGSQSESIYYMQDEDSAYIGMNRATGDVIDLYFKNEDLIKVLFINEIQGKMYPMKQIPEDQRELKLFKWLDDRRPKNRAELFE